MNTHELAWAAGFFDGEGCTTFAVQKKKGTAQRPFGMPHVCISQKDRSVLDRFRAAVGVGIVTGPHRNGKTEMYQYRAYRWADAQAVIAFLWKFLSGRKREQARTILLRYKEQWDTRPTGRRRPRKNLNEGQVRAIRADVAEAVLSRKLIAEKHGVSTAQVWNIAERRTWKHVT